MPIDFPPSSFPKAIGPANLISKIIFDQAVHKGKPLTPETLQLVNYFHKLFGEKEEEGNYPFILTRGAENPDLETNAVEQDKRSTYGSTSWSYRGDNGMAHVPVIQSIWFLLLGKSYSTYHSCISTSPIIYTKTSYEQFYCVQVETKLCLIVFITLNLSSCVITSNKAVASRRFRHEASLSLKYFSKVMTQ